MKSLEPRMKRIEEAFKRLRPIYSRLEMIIFDDGETREEALAKRPDIDPEDPDLRLIIIVCEEPGEPEATCHPAPFGNQEQAL